MYVQTLFFFWPIKWHLKVRIVFDKWECVVYRPIQMGKIWSFTVVWNLRKHYTTLFYFSSPFSGLHRVSAWSLSQPVCAVDYTAPLYHFSNISNDFPCECIWSRCWLLHVCHAGRRDCCDFWIKGMFSVVLFLQWDLKKCKNRENSFLQHFFFPFFDFFLWFCVPIWLLNSGTPDCHHIQEGR